MTCVSISPFFPDFWTVTASSLDFLISSFLYPYPCPSSLSPFLSAASFVLSPAAVQSRRRGNGSDLCGEVTAVGGVVSCAVETGGGICGENAAGESAALEKSGGICVWMMREEIFVEICVWVGVYHQQD